MSYQARAKYKTIKRYIYKIRESMKFKTGHISNAGKVVLFGSVIVLFSLFNTWVDSTSGDIVGNGFSRVSGKPAIIILICMAMVYFSLFSVVKKEKLQLISNLYFRDYATCILSGIFTVIIAINSLNYIGWLQMFESDIIAGKWPVLAICGWVIIAVWGFLMKQESSKNIKWTFIMEQENSKKSAENSEKDNMKLPF